MFPAHWRNTYISVGGPRHKFQNVPKYQRTDPVTHRKRHLRAGKVRSWLPNESSACLKCSRRASPNLSRHRFVFTRFVFRYNGISLPRTREIYAPLKFSSLERLTTNFYWKSDNRQFLYMSSLEKITVLWKK